MLEFITMDVFSRHLNESFHIQFDTGEIKGLPGPLELELVEVSRLGTKQHETDGRQPFSILFRGPRDPVLPQQIYSITHKKLDVLQIFLVPIGPDKTGMLYEAVFT